ncbi:MAG: NADH:flavin oxidoreductase [Negativicutes bacterium]
MSILFTPISIGSFTVKNRFVRSATQDYLGNEDGSISEAELLLYSQLAQNDVGLIISAHSYVQHPLGKASIRQNAIYEDRFITGYKQVTETVHRYGAKFVLQISHAGRQTTSDLIDNLTPVAPSAVTNGVTGITPRELSEAEIQQLIADYAAAMRRAKDANCDGVQLHIAHGYLLAQFLSPYTNKRTDMWGGSIENRTRIFREIIAAGRKQVGDQYPILVKLNSTDGLVGSGYLSLEDVIYTAKLLEQCGVCAIEISGGMHEAKGVMAQPGVNTPEKEAYFAKTSQALKKAVAIPIILVGGLRSLKIMENVVANGVADMVSLSRPFIKEPDLVQHLQHGAKEVQCISCNACFNPAGLRCYYKGGTPS